MARFKKFVLISFELQALTLNNSQSSLAKRYNVSQATISRWRSGTVIPKNLNVKTKIHRDFIAFSNKNNATAIIKMSVPMVSEDGEKRIFEINVPESRLEKAEKSFIENVVKLDQYQSEGWVFTIKSASINYNFRFYGRIQPKKSTVKL